LSGKAADINLFDENIEIKYTLIGELFCFIKKITEKLLSGLKNSTRAAGREVFARR